MFVFQARFADGRIDQRRAQRTYKVAWRLRFRVNGDLSDIIGFCTTRQLADDALAEQARLMRPRRGRNAVYISSEVVCVSVVD